VASRARTANYGSSDYNFCMGRYSGDSTNVEREKSARGLRVFGNKPFMRFAKKFGASEADLWEMCNREPEADLGGQVFKFRLARQGEGKSGGGRTIVAVKEGQRAVMMFGFEKKDLANITTQELKALKKLAKQYLDRSAEEIERLVKLKELEECHPPKRASPK
jgi:hypothetical protein